MRDRLFPSTRNLVPYSDLGWALKQARLRQSTVLEFIESPDRDDLAERRARQPQEIGPDEVWARRLVLARQLEQPELLLAGRIGDLLVAALRDFCRAGERSFGNLIDELEPIVTVRPVPRLLLLLQRDLFAMRVVILTRRPDLLSRILELATPPSGIGVDLVKGGGAEPQLQGACIVGGGQGGTVAGSLERPNGLSFRPTCAHAVASNCPSSQPSPPPERRSEVTYLPDAVLLDGGTRCFQLGATHPVLPATEPQMQEMAGECRRVRRVGGRRGGRGRVQSRVVGMPDSHGDGLCCFPSLLIDPRRRRWLLWDSPLRGRGFSREGDSGSWVVDEDERIWVGMVVSGTRDRSLAHEAAPLLKWFEREVSEGQTERGWTCMCSTAS